MPKFLNNINLEQANDIQFKTTAGANAGKISQDGNDLVLTNAVGDIIIGNGNDDVYIGDGVNNVDIRFEQNMAIYADSASTKTLTLGGENTSLILESPTIYDINSSPGTSGQILSSTATGVDWVDTSSISAGNAEHVVIYVKNTSGSTINKGTPVYITGTVGATDTVEIAPADAGNSAKMPAVGLLDDTLANNAFGYVITGGFMDNITTDPIDSATPSSNDTVYVKAGGGLTLTKPTGSNLIQNIAKVGKVSGGNAGSLIVSSILRTNDVPNLTTGKIWVGTANNTAESTVVHLDEPNGRMGIGTTGASEKLEVNGTIKTSTGLIKGANASAYINLDGTIGSRLRYGNQYLTANASHLVFSTNDSVRMTVTNGGNVGIGTTSPSAKLQVANGNFLVNGGGVRQIDIQSTNGEVRFGLKGNNGNQFKFVSDGTHIKLNDATKERIKITNAGDITFGGRDSGGNQATWMTLEDQTGNVGIGATNPGATLEIAKGSEGDYLIVGGDNASNGRALVFTSSTATSNGALHTIRAQSSNGQIAFSTNTSEALRIDSSQNVGIGTTSPSKKLDVAGDWILDGITGGHFENYTYGSQLDISEITSGGWARANRIVTSDSDAYVFSGVLGDDTTLTRAYWTIGSSSDPTGYTYSNGIILLKNGNVGIGTTNPGYTLDVNGTLHSSNITLADGIYHEGDTNTYINFLSDTIQMATAGSVRAYINSSGNVGIGTTSPSARLQVTASGLGAKIHSSQTTGLEVSGGGNSQDIARFQNVAGYTKVTIDTDGNVGIGTTDPGTKLDVAVSETGKTWVDYAGTVGTFERNGDSNINIVSSNTGNGGVWFGDTDSMVRGRIRYEHTNDKMEFWTSNSEKVTIEGGGNVGIGTTSPSEKLEVNGTVKATAATDAYKGYIKNTITCTPLMKSANTNYNYIPYNTTAFGSTPDYFNRMVTPYDGRVKKIILRHISGVTPTATGMKFKKEVNGTVSTTEYTATVTGGASTSFTAIYNFANSDFTFSEGDSIGILAKATGGTGEISGASAQIIVEYNIT